MKNCLLFFLTLVIFTITSCKKETEKKTITFNNKLYTVISITCNGETKNIPANCSATFEKIDASSVSYTGNTKGQINDSIQIGLNLQWNGQIEFSNSSMAVDLISSKDIFFLKIQNTGLHLLQDLIVNFGLPEQTYDKISFQNDAQTYPTGYYKLVDSTNVRLSYTDTTNQIQYINKHYHSDFILPVAENQSVTVNFNPAAKSMIFETKSIAITPGAIPQYAIAE